MPIDFGSDFSCIEDFEEELRVISDPAMIIAHALIRRWSTPRGMLLDDEDYGTDLREFINDDVDQLALVRMRAEARAEALKETDRIIDCTIASSSFDHETNTLIVAFLVQLSEGALRLKISVDAVTVDLLSVENA